MDYPRNRRTQVFTGPGFDNRPFRTGVVKGFSQKQNLDPRRFGADAAAMLEDEAGLKFDNQGNLGSTRNYQRDLILGSQQRNSLSPGVKAGYGSTLRTPLNSNLTPRSFSEGIRQRNQTLTPGAPAMSREQRVAQAQQDGSFGAIRDQYNQTAKNFGKQMDEAGNIQPLAPYRPGLNSPTVQSQATNKAGLEDRASGLRLLREMSQTPLKVENASGGKNLTGQYGTGRSAPTTPGAKNQGMINGKPASEALQELANKPGIARKGDKYQPQKWTAEELRKLKLK